MIASPNGFSGLLYHRWDDDAGRAERISGSGWTILVNGMTDGAQVPAVFAGPLGSLSLSPALAAGSIEQPFKRK